MRAGSPIFSYQNYMTLYTKLSDALQRFQNQADCHQKNGPVCAGVCTGRGFSVCDGVFARQRRRGGAFVRGSLSSGRGRMAFFSRGTVSGESCPVRMLCGNVREGTGPESGRKRKRTRKLFSQVLEICGAAGEIRTPGLQVRSLLLYPAELQPHPEKRSIPSWISSQAFFAPFFLFSVSRWRKFGGGAGTSASIGWPLS